MKMADIEAVKILSKLFYLLIKIFFHGVTCFESFIYF